LTGSERDWWKMEGEKNKEERQEYREGEILS
jgi:hypothetical protein